MASNIYELSIVAGSNSAVGGMNWAEGQDPGSVNDSARQFAALIAQLLGDIGGALSAGGTANGLTVTANSGFTTLVDGRIIAFRATADNTTAATLNVNGIGAKSIRKMDATGDVALGGGEIQDTGIYIAQYSTALNGAAGGWLLVNPTLSNVTIAGDLTVSGGDITIGLDGGNADIGASATNGATQLKGDTPGGAFLGGVVRVYGSTHASQANDIEFFSAGTQKYLYDASNSTPHRFSDGRMYIDDGFRVINDVLAPGAGNNSIGIEAASDARLFVSADASSITANVTSDGTVVSLRSGGTNRGSISIAGAVTSFNTSSDRRYKDNFEAFDAGVIIDALDLWRFNWKMNDEVGYGVIAQDAVKVFPTAITENEDGFYEADYSKYVPLLLAEVKALRARVAHLEATR